MQSIVHLVFNIRTQKFTCFVASQLFACYCIFDWTGGIRAKNETNSSFSFLKEVQRSKNWLPFYDLTDIQFQLDYPLPPEKPNSFFATLLALCPYPWLRIYRTRAHHKKEHFIIISIIFWVFGHHQLFLLSIHGLNDIDCYMMWSVTLGNGYAGTYHVTFLRSPIIPHPPPHHYNHLYYIMQTKVSPGLWYHQKLLTKWH